MKAYTLKVHSVEAIQFKKNNNESQILRCMQERDIPARIGDMTKDLFVREMHVKDKWWVVIEGSIVRVVDPREFTRQYEEFK